MLQLKLQEVLAETPAWDDLFQLLISVLFSTVKNLKKNTGIATTDVPKT